MTTIPMPSAEALKAIRAKYQMTNADLGGLLGCTPDDIARHLDPKASDPCMAPVKSLREFAARRRLTIIVCPAEVFEAMPENLKSRVEIMIRA